MEMVQFGPCKPFSSIKAMTDVTRILSQIESGDPHAAGQLLPLVYDELRKLAAARLAQEKPGQTLQATALVHEAFLRLVATSDGEPSQGGTRWDGRGHFFAAAAEAMRRILVENARRKKRLKRGGDMIRKQFDDFAIEAPEIHEDLVALDAALGRLKTVDSQAVELVHLRYFAGLSIREAAEMLGVSPRTADRVWAFARAWLHREVASAEGDEKK
jgi:RNA polymerase sigma factor (TIGR02999 family)